MFGRRGRTAPGPRSAAGLRRIVTGLALPPGWTRDTLVEVVARRRRRPIQLVPIDAAVIGGQYSGAWLKRDHDDLVVYADSSSLRHSTNVVCHELTHMLLRHDEVATPESAADAVDVVRAVSRPGVRAVFGRSGYADEQEYEAELLAGMIIAARRPGFGDDAAGRIAGSF
ncbi:hypothetical protein [Rhodococcus rhodnii]|uniref:hypothetical protein n=1 Tax=Rhodococcus rhodnii TaxID=38312 RepID=UPI000906E321|nr:hypothetical protein [Rhodococcus rhodnii]